MNSKILAGILVILCIAGIGFAWGGFIGKPFVETLPDDVKEQFKEAFEEKDFETLRELREQYFPERMGPLANMNEETREEIISLKQQIHEAMASDDYETVKELREELRDLLPGKGLGRFGHMKRHGPRMGTCCPCVQPE